MYFLQLYISMLDCSFNDVDNVTAKSLLLVPCPTSPGLVGPSSLPVSFYKISNIHFFPKQENVENLSCTLPPLPCYHHQFELSLFISEKSCATRSIYKG